MTQRPVANECSVHSNDIRGKGTDYDKYISEHKNAKLLGIHGKWYDVTDFIPHHPGGKFIEKLAGKDVTCQFVAFHNRDVLRGRSAVGCFGDGKVSFITQKYCELHTRLREQGMFDTDYVWYAQQIGLSAVFLFATIFCVTYCGSLHGSLLQGGVCLDRQTCMISVLAGILMGMFWQQCGFMMHDLMHNQVTKNRNIDQVLGRICGTIGIGVNGTWWRDEHFEHHSFTNVFDPKTGYYDPQMREDVWVQNRILFPTYKRVYFITRLLQYIAIKAQKYTFMFILFSFGRIGILIDAMHLERKWQEITCFSLHWLWVLTLLSQLKSWKLALVMYASSALYQGVLHTQLVLSHYSKQWSLLEEVSDSREWPVLQIETNRNVNNAECFDWFYGGLNFHIEHHLFPIIPRCNLRKVHTAVKEFCLEIGQKYDSQSLLFLIYSTLQHMGCMSKQFSYSDVLGTSHIADENTR